MRENVTSILKRRLTSRCNDINNELKAYKFDTIHFNIFDGGG